MSLRAKLLISVLFVTFLAWGIASFNTYQDTRLAVDHLFDAHLVESATALLEHAVHERREMILRGETYEEKKRTGEFEDDFKEVNIDEHAISELRVRGKLLEKRLLFAIWTSKEDLLFGSSKDLIRAPANEGFSFLNQGHQKLRTFTKWDRKRNLRVVIGESMHARHSLARVSVANMLQSIFWMIVPLIFLLVLIIEWNLWPIRRLSQDVAGRTAHDLTPIKSPNTPTELKPMMKALNVLFKRLESAIENERRFTADAAHELRTPLAGIKVQAQVALRESDDSLRAQALRAVVSGVDRATHLVTQLLTLARLDPQSSVSGTICSLRALVTKELQEIAPTAIVKEIDLELLPGDSGQVLGNQSMLSILIRNTLDNAIRYSPPRGRVQISIENEKNRILLTIEDMGKGLTEQQIQSIGKRFSRVQRPSGEGSGLGLSIVMKIADIHHAKVSFENKPRKSGLLVKVSFPKTKEVPSS